MTRDEDLWSEICARLPAFTALAKRYNMESSLDSLLRRTRRADRSVSPWEWRTLMDELEFLRAEEEDYRGRDGGTPASTRTVFSAVQGEYRCPSRTCGRREVGPALAEPPLCALHDLVMASAD